VRNCGWEWLVLGLGGLRSWFEGIVAGGGGGGGEDERDEGM